MEKDNVSPYFDKIGIDFSVMLEKLYQKHNEEEFDFINIETVDTINALNIDEAWAIGHFISIQRTLIETLNKFYLSVIANDISETIDDNKYKVYWTYVIRNPFARNIISDLYSILDYIAFFINNLSDNCYFKKDRDVSFSRLYKKIEEGKINPVGFITESDLEIIKSVIKQLNKVFIKEYRNIRDTGMHRHFIPIEEAGIPIKKDFVTIPNHTEKTSYYGEGYVSNFGSYSYKEIYNINYNLLQTIDKALIELLKISSLKKIIKK